MSQRVSAPAASRTEKQRERTHRENPRRAPCDGREGANIAVVPTMGALHEGHLSLVRAALAQADRVIVTLFVNPKQFNSAADLAAYPRTEDADAAKLAPLGAHMLYAPDAGEIRAASSTSIRRCQNPHGVDRVP